MTDREILCEVFRKANNAMYYNCGDGEIGNGRVLREICEIIKNYSSIDVKDDFHIGWEIFN